MTGLILSSFIFLTIWSPGYSLSIEKRQACGSGGCISSCGGGSCNTNNRIQTCPQCTNKCSRQCSSNQCFSNCLSTCNQSGCNTNNRVQECSQCANKCSSQCPNRQCQSNCLSGCKQLGCDTTETLDIRNEQLIPNIIQPQPPTTNNNNKCCYVMHPKNCFTDENGTKRCVIRRHKECSDICTSSVVSIQETDENTNTGCQYVRNYPYAYCGNYERKDCGQCYNCKGSYNPSECFKQSECSESCRKNIPNCVQTQSGIQCY